MSRYVCGICLCPYDDDGTCGCPPRNTVTVRYDCSAAETETAIRQKLIELGWTPPGQTQDDTTLLRQALEALEYYRSAEDYQPTPASESIAALKERLNDQ